MRGCLDAGMPIENLIAVSYRGTSLLRNRPPLGTYSSIGPSGGPRGGGRFLMSEVPLYMRAHSGKRPHVYETCGNRSRSPATSLHMRTHSGERPYRGTSPIRKRTPLGPYGRTMPRVLRGS